MQGSKRFSRIAWAAIPTSSSFGFLRPSSKVWQFSSRFFNFYAIGTEWHYASMKKLILFICFLFVTIIPIIAHPINNYKYVVIQHQDEAAKDVEPRMVKEFSNLGFVVLSEEEATQLDEQSQKELLNAKYRCRQSGECIFKLELINNSGEEIYEDEQIFGGGFMSRKNDRQGAIKRIFKALKKLNYQYSPTIV